MKRLFLVLSILLLTGCGKEAEADIPSLSVDQFTTEVVIINPYSEENLFFAGENYNYYLVYSNQPANNNSTTTTFSVHIESYNLDTGECKVISSAYENIFFNEQFQEQNKVFYSTETFTQNSEIIQGSLFCLDKKAQTFAPVLSKDTIYLANNENSAYFFDFSSVPSLVSLDLVTLQSKYLLDLPDIVLESGCIIDGEIIDNVLYIRSSVYDITISEILYSIMDTTYTLSKNYKKINFFKTYETFIAYNPETYEIYSVSDVLFDSYKNGILYSSTEFVDNDKIIIRAYNAQELSPVFAGADYITEYANALLEEHLYSASFGSLSYSDYAISNYSRVDDDNGFTTFTYNYLYKPTSRYSTILNDYTQSSTALDYQNGTFTLTAYYLVNSYVIDFSHDNVSAYDNLSDNKVVTLYKDGDIIFESERNLESGSTNETYSKGEHIYSYNSITHEATDIAHTLYNSFFLNIIDNKLFLTSTEAPSFHGYNCHQISYIDLADNSFKTLSPTVSIFAIKNNLAYYLDSTNMIGVFDFTDLSFTTLETFEKNGDFINGAVGYIKDDCLYVKISNTSSDYQEISLKN